MYLIVFTTKTEPELLRLVDLSAKHLWIAPRKSKIKWSQTSGTLFAPSWNIVHISFDTEFNLILAYILGKFTVFNFSKEYSTLTTPTLLVNNLWATCVKTCLPVPHGMRNQVSLFRMARENQESLLLMAIVPWRSVWTVSERLCPWIYGLGEAALYSLQ